MSEPSAHIFLTPENSVKVQGIALRLNRSSNDIVNTIVANLESIDIEQRIGMKIKAEPGKPRPEGGRSRIVKKSSSNWP
jgi:hypothetical protein